MEQILIRYRPFARLPFERTFTGRFPSRWEELSPEQFTALANLSESEPPERLVPLFTGLPGRVCRNLDAYQLSNIWWITDWIREEKPLDRFLIPSIGEGLVCPRPGLRGMSFGRFIFCDMACDAYNEGGEPADLHRFLASLYAPEGIGFTGELPRDLLERVGRVPQRTSRALLLNYALVRRWLASRYPLLFSVPDFEDKDPAPEKPSPRVKSSASWIRVFDSLVGDDISRHQQYADIPLHNVLRYLTARTKENMKKR